MPRPMIQSFVTVLLSKNALAPSAATVAGPDDMIGGKAGEAIDVLDDCYVALRRVRRRSRLQAESCIGLMLKLRFAASLNARCRQSSYQCMSLP